MACLDDAELAAFVEGRLQGAALEAARTHTDTCDECQRLVAAYTGAFGVAAINEEKKDERYRLVAVLGTGAMGIVHHAHDSSLDRAVALKVLRKGLGIEEERLVREARAMAKLRHPNAVTVFDAGRLADGTAFVAMELVEGTTLRAWLAKDLRPRDEVLRVFAQAARGLAAAHALGIVHRDFKPDNVLVTKDGHTAKVADFGLARRLDNAGAPLSQPSKATTKDDDADTKLTAHGTVVGTPAYMAPEQHDGREADARADQFAFFVALYEAIAGKRPFAGDTPKEVRLAIARGPDQRDGAGLPSSVASRLRSLILKGLEEKPTRRHASMDEVASILEEIATPKRRPIAAAVAIGAAVLLFAGVLVLNRRGDDDSMKRAAAATISPECRALTSKLMTGVTKEEEAAVTAAFDRSKEPHATDARDRFIAIIRERISTIAEARSAACGGGAHEGLESRGEVECLQTLLDDAHAVVAFAHKVNTRAGLDGAIVAARAIEPPAVCRGALPDPNPKDEKDRRERERDRHDDGIEHMLFELPLDVAPVVASVEAPTTKPAVLRLVRVLRVRVREGVEAFPGEAEWDGINDAIAALPGQFDRMREEQKRAADLAAQRAFERDGSATAPTRTATGKSGIGALLSRALAGAEALRLEAIRAEILLLRAENDGVEPSEEVSALVSRAAIPQTTATLEMILARRAAYEGRVLRAPSLEHALALDVISRSAFADALVTRNELSRDQTKSEIGATVATAEATWGPWHARTAVAHVQAAEWLEARGVKALAEESSRRAMAILEASVASPSRRGGTQSMYLARALAVLASTASEAAARDAFLADAERLAKGPLASAIRARPSIVSARLALDHHDARAAMKHAASAEAAAGEQLVTRAEAIAVLAEAALENQRTASDRDAAAPLFARALASAALLAPRDRARLRLAAARRLSAPPRSPADLELAKALAEQSAREALDPTAAQALLTSLGSVVP